MLIELSHTIEPGMTTYPGLPAPEIVVYQSRSEGSYAEGTSFEIANFAFVGNTGTYLDAPFHRFEDGDDLDALDLSKIANVNGLVVSTGAAPVHRDVLEGLDLGGMAVLIHTGWANHWQSERYFTGYPFITKGAAELLASEGVALVGIDSLNVDDNRDPMRPTHTALLRAGIPIVEHLRGLETLPANGFRFFAVPPRLRRGTSFPVRAFAIVD